MDSQTYSQGQQSKKHFSQKQYEILKPCSENITDKDSRLKFQEQQSVRGFSQEQYEMLKLCSENKDTTEWNKWREDNPHENIMLEGALLPGAELRSANLKHAHLERAILLGAHLEEADLFDSYLEGINLGRAYLTGANLKHAYLQGADLFEAHLEDTNLKHAYLEEAILLGAHLEGADLSNAYLEGVNLGRVHLEEANLKHAHLQGANLSEAHLEDTNLKHAHLEGAILLGAQLEGANLSFTHLMDADFSRSIVNGKTLLWECEVNRYTKFEGVGLGNMRIYPKTKQLLEYNIRRMNWEKWYSKKNKSLPEICNLIIWLMKRPIHIFWAISDYGMSTGRIIVSFFGLAFIFAAAYRLCPSLVAFNGKTTVQDFHNFLHAFYFSVVTMTTMGLGDIAANPDSWQGQLLLILQVILGYILLGTLITRLVVLFTSGGPADKFADK